MADPQPTIGRIVVYRNRRGVDMPAIITAPTTEPGFVHLHLFPPPGEAGDLLDREWGTGYSAEPVGLSWRWPERAEGKAA